MMAVTAKQQAHVQRKWRALRIHLLKQHLEIRRTLRSMGYRLDPDPRRLPA